jgi:hypothetical protein
LNGTEANKEYNLDKVANFTAFLGLPNREIYLNSNYTGFTLQSNSTSLITNLINITAPGLFGVTAYWNGDENYSASTKTYYIDDLPPRYLTRSEYPISPTYYNYNMAYIFGSTWYDLNMSQVYFESNFSGSFRNYTIITSPNVQNSSNAFSIAISSVPAETFLYRWIAFDSLNRATNSTYYEYDVLKGLPLTIDIKPSKSVLWGTKTTVICTSATNQVPLSNFKLYRNISLIDNDTMQSRKDEQTFLSQGAYVYVCNNTATQNFTNQTIKVILNVTLTNPTPVITNTLNLTGPSSVQAKLGEANEEEFILENNLGQTLSNFTITLTGIDSSWYNISELPSSIPGYFSLRVNVKFTIPSDAQKGDYNSTLRIASRTTNETKVVLKTFMLSVTEPSVETFPPIYSETLTNELSGGYEFSLKWNDDAGLSGYIFSSNSSGEWENESWIPLSGTEGWSYAMKNETLNPGSAIAWKFYVNDSNNVWAESEEFLSTLKGSQGDMTTPIIIVSVFIVLLAVIIIFVEKVRSKNKAPKKEEVNYVYRKEDIN